MIIDRLSDPAAQHALIAAALVAVVCGLIGPFVITRKMAFAVHGTAELAFTGAAAGLLVADAPIAGAYIGTIIFAVIMGALGVKEGERDSTIGVIFGFGLGLGVLFLSYYNGNETTVEDILFGDILGVSGGQLFVLGAVAIVSIVVMVLLYRPLLFASVDPDVASARGVPVRALGIVFLVILAATVTEASQIVGTLLVLSLAITPAAAAQRLSANPVLVALLSILFALVAAVGGLLVSFQSTTITPSVFVTSISFGIYLLARLGGPLMRDNRNVVK